MAIFIYLQRFSIQGLNAIGYVQLIAVPTTLSSSRNVPSPKTTNLNDLSQSKTFQTRAFAVIIGLSAIAAVFFWPMLTMRR